MLISSDGGAARFLENPGFHGKRQHSIVVMGVIALGKTRIFGSFLPDSDGR
jgi:hypothetical protein